MCIRDRIPLPANGSQNHHHILPVVTECETCTHATASTTGGPHVPRSADPFPSPKCFLCPLCPITEPAGGPHFGWVWPFPRILGPMHPCRSGHDRNRGELQEWRIQIPRQVSGPEFLAYRLSYPCRSQA